MRAYVILPLLLLAVACGGPENAPAAPVVASSAKASPTAQPTASAEPAPSSSVPPPAGLYDVAVNEKSSTCVKADGGAGGPFGNKDQFVAARHKKDGAYGVNLPFVAMGGMGIMRSDVLLEKGKVANATSHPDPKCKYEAKHDIEVLDVSPTSIKVAVRAEYGDATGCTTLPKTGVPTSCKRETEHTFTLVKAACPSWKCTAEMRTGPGGMQFTCKDCPDAVDSRR